MKHCRDVHLIVLILWTEIIFGSRMNSSPHTNITDLAQVCWRRERERKRQRNLDDLGPRHDELIWISLEELVLDAVHSLLEVFWGIRIIFRHDPNLCLKKTPWPYPHGRSILQFMTGFGKSASKIPVCSSIVLSSREILLLSNQNFGMLILWDTEKSSTQRGVFCLNKVVTPFPFTILWHSLYHLFLAHWPFFYWVIFIDLPQNYQHGVINCSSIWMLWPWHSNPVLVEADGKAGNTSILRKSVPKKGFWPHPQEDSVFLILFLFSCMQNSWWVHPIILSHLWWG